MMIDRIQPAHNGMPVPGDIAADRVQQVSMKQEYQLKPVVAADGYQSFVADMFCHYGYKAVG
jgi:hypothetical protein